MLITLIPKFLVLYWPSSSIGRIDHLNSQQKKKRKKNHKICRGIDFTRTELSQLAFVKNLLGWLMQILQTTVACHIFKVFLFENTSFLVIWPQEWLSLQQRKQPSYWNGNENPNTILWKKHLWSVGIDQYTKKPLNHWMQAIYQSQSCKSSQV